jgi:hypothetical protein
MGICPYCGSLAEIQAVRYWTVKENKPNQEATIGIEEEKVIICNKCLGLKFGYIKPITEPLKESVTK